MIEAVHMDVLEWAASYDGEPFHAILTDPPYHLSDPRSAKRASPDAKQRANVGGFMAQAWDGGDIAFRPETWAALAKHLHPGAFIFAFASSRGWHRQACAMEDAGLVMHPTMFGWVFASGFPKATRIDKVARDAKEDRDEHAAGDFGMKNRCSKCGKPFFSGNPCQCPKPKSDHPFAGHRYGLQAIKPALEPIIVAQKPYVGKPVECITKTGAGALNIDAGRIPLQENEDVEKLNARSGGTRGFVESTVYGSSDGLPPGCDLSKGRWPANFYLGDREAADRLDQQSGHLKSGEGKCVRSKPGIGYHGNLGNAGDEQKLYGDSGGASRFFFRVQEQIDEADPVRYVPKASRSERTCDDTIECGHPTVKPVSLTTWCASLLMPPVEYAPRRLLIPFAGVFSEAIGAMNAGWEHITCIEQSAEYIEIGKARAAYYATKQEKTEKAPLFDLAE